MTPNKVDLIAGAELATGLLASQGPEPQAQAIFMREVGASQLSHYGWVYLLSTLLALRLSNPADAAPPQAASGANAPA